MLRTRKNMYPAMQDGYKRDRLRGKTRTRGRIGNHCLALDLDKTVRENVPRRIEKITIVIFYANTSNLYNFLIDLGVRTNIIYSHLRAYKPQITTGCNCGLVYKMQVHMHIVFGSTLYVCI